MDERYLNIFLKKQSGEASEKEIADLQQWLENNENNEKSVQKLNAILQNVQGAFQTYEPDTTEAWGKFKNAVLNEPEEIKTSMISPGLLIKAAAAIVILFGLTFFFLTNDYSGSSQEYSEVLTQDNFMTYYLPDNSFVRLNKNSKLTIKFGNEYTERRVFLSGEAFFEIKKDAKRPFIVETENSEVRVLGTSFNVLTLPGSETTEVEVVEGLVEVRISDKNQSQNVILLSADEKIIYNNISGSFQKLTGENEKFEWWLDNAHKKTNITF
jgi:transmembrane sensor